MQTQAEAEAFVHSHKGLGDSVIRPSGHYPKLASGYFLVIAWRLASLQDAQNDAKDLHKEGADRYVRLAY